MTATKIHIDTFKTRLGDINLDLLCDATVSAISDMNNPHLLFQTLAHRIEIIAFQDLKNWVKNTDFSIEDSKGWIIRIIKTNDFEESILFNCILDKNSNDIQSEVDSGEHLDSLWIENKTDVISIGTENGEMMKHRALKNDWIPSRFQSDLGYQSNTEFSFTKYLELGFETKIPKLKNGERFYFHYLIATNSRKKSKDYPNEEDISTNLAVDYPKWTLIEKLHIEEN